IGLNFVVHYKVSVCKCAWCDGSETTFDVNYSEADDMGRGIGTQEVEGLSQTSYVPGFDPSQTKKKKTGSMDNPVKKEKIEINTAPPPSQWEKWCQGLQLSDSPLPQDASPQASLYYISEESWKGFTEWALNPIPLTIGTRVVSAGKWLGNERVNTTLTRWAPRRVVFMSAMFCLQVDAAYKKFLPNKKPINCLIYFLVNSSSTSRDRLAKQRRISTKCDCDEAVSCFTSKIIKNPGRLFHCCPLGSQKVSRLII
ncbi:hypothetical protein HID58_042647, partial [Brassica napus]